MPNKKVVKNTNNKVKDYTFENNKIKNKTARRTTNIKCLGNCRFNVLCFDGKERITTM